jgi:hypothetical protein
MPLDAEDLLTALTVRLGVHKAARLLRRAAVMAEQAVRVESRKDLPGQMHLWPESGPTPPEACLAACSSV